MAGDDPLCVLLLDGVLERVAFAERARDLLRAPAVVAVEPGRRPPGLLVAGVARRLGRRLPGAPRVLVLCGSAQAPLAAALLRRHPGAELWCTEDVRGPLRDGAALVFAPGGGEGPAFRANAPLWDRLEALGIAGR